MAPLKGQTYLKVCSKDTGQVADGQQGQGVVVASPADKPEQLDGFLGFPA